MLDMAGAEKKSGGRGRVFALCLFFFIAALVSGCAGVNGTTGEDYFTVLDRWSRGEKVYEGLEARLYMNATFKTPEFRKAYVERYAKSYELSTDHAKAMMDREAEQALAYNEFFFTAFTPEGSLNDFEQSGSVWQVYLEDAKGNRAKPISIKAFANSEPVVREFFPYFDLWSKAYTIQFPKYADSGDEINPSAGPVKLIVTGVMGKGELNWGK